MGCAYALSNRSGWLPFVGSAIILLVLLFVVLKRKIGDKQETTSTENLNYMEK